MGVSVVAGTSGCGKTTLFEKGILLPAQYGDLPESTLPKDAPKPDLPVLFICPNNEGVDKFHRGLLSFYQNLGLAENAPDVIRLYSPDSEIASMLAKADRSAKTLLMSILPRQTF